MRRVSAFVRLWLINDAMGELDVETLRVLSAAQAHVCYAPPNALEFARRLRLALSASVEIVEWLDEWNDLALRRLADRHGGSSVLVVLPKHACETLSGIALDPTVSAPRVNNLDTSRVCTIDWPPSADHDGRPAFIGLDLDWNPPPPPARRAKFPGGPGSAPAARG